jgi:hypothetical protein
MGIFRRIAASREWWNMIPDQCIFDAGTESSGRTLNAALRRRDRRGAIAYISHPCHVRIHLDRISTPFVQTTWINPATGEEQEGGIHATGNGIPGGVFPLRTAAWFQTPQCWEDAVLLLDGVSKAS